MLRAAQTAAVVAKGLRIPVLLDDRLRERKAEDPAPGVTAADDDPDQVRERFASIVSEIVGSCSGETVLIVSHGNILARGLLSMCSNLEVDFVARHSLGNCSMVEVTVGEAGTWTCLSWADQSLASSAPRPPAW